MSHCKTPLLLCRKVTFTQTSNPAGFGVWTEFTGDAAGDGLRGHYLFYADGLNGIWQYEEATDMEPTTFRHWGY